MKSKKIPKNTPKKIKPLKKSHPTYLPPKLWGKTPKLGTLVMLNNNSNKTCAKATS